MKESLPCIVCRKQTYRVWDDAPETQPGEGLCFEAVGHYGSTAFDPMDMSSLEIMVCDDCLRQADKDACETRESSPDVPIRRWLVEVHPEARRDVGQFEDVGAAFFEIKDGCLIFRDNRGEVVYARAAGTWLTCVPEEE